MKARLGAWWEALHTSFWFVPSLMCLGTVALSAATIGFDRSANGQSRGGWLWSGGVDGAREVLSTIAGSVITVAGVTFSITITALVLASSQFGPRLLRTFMRDVGNQLVLGTFLSTFLYCLLVLRTVRGAEDSRFVPALSVTIGVGLAVLSVAVLIYFIHHVASSIQADNLCAAVADEMFEGIERMFPQRIGGPAPAAERFDWPADFDRTARVVPSRKTGYIQAVDGDVLLELARERDVLLQLEAPPGDFVAEGEPLARVHPPGGDFEALADEVRENFTLGRQRTPEQDAEFSIGQLTEIAARALSPGINDPRTAMVCADWLGAGLGRLAEREFPPALRRDETGRARVLASVQSFESLAEAALSPMRRYGCKHVSVTLRLLQAIQDCAPHLCRAADRNTLRRHAGLIAGDGCREACNESDQACIEERHRKALQALVEGESGRRKDEDDLEHAEL